MSAESERVLLGCLLRDNAQAKLIDVTTGDFSVTAYGQVFEAARRMINGGKVTDALTVAELLETETGRRDWLPLLVAMQRECLAPANAPAYAEAIRRASITRQAVAIGNSLVQGGEIDEAIKRLLALNSTQRDHTCHQLEAMQEAVDAIMNASEGQLSGVRTGMRDLDEAIGGLHDEDLIVVAARPAMGKTAFMLNLGLAADVPVGVFSGEQGRQQVGMRLLSMAGQISLHKMRTGTMNDADWPRITATMNKAKDRPVWIYDKPAPTIDDIVRQARAWKFDQNVGVIMIDYLQKLRGGNGENFRLQVGDITTQLKDLARELKVPVVLLAQVKREVESRPMGSDGLGRMPYMGDIAETGIVEQEADQVITLYRPEVYDDSPQYNGIAYVNICKNRHGPTGYKKLSWRGEYLQFGDLARTEAPYQDRWSAAS